jgi:hypothetical protein
MFCPKCGVEYREGFKQCSDCGVDLVESRPVSARAENPGSHDTAVAVWRGDDPVAFSAILAALEEANIPARQLSLHEQFSGIFAIQPPAYEILVHPDNAAQAEKVIRDALQPDSSGSSASDDSPA